MRQNNITDDKMSESMIETLKKDSLSFSYDLTEVAIDSILDDGILRDIPVLKSIVGIYKTIGNISDVLFTRKLATFLLHIKDTDPGQRQKAINNLIANPKYRTRVGELLLNMIDRCDNTQKAEWLSILFRVLVLEKQLPDVFMRTEKVLSNVSIIDMINFLGLPKNKFDHLSLEEGEFYANSGLYRLDGKGIFVDENKFLNIGEEYSYKITEAGFWIYSIINNCYS